MNHLACPCQTPPYCICRPVADKQINQPYGSYSAIGPARHTCLEFFYLRIPLSHYPPPQVTVHPDRQTHSLTPHQLVTFIPFFQFLSPCSFVCSLTLDHLGLLMQLYISGNPSSSSLCHKEPNSNVLPTSAFQILQPTMAFLPLALALPNYPL